VEEVAQELGYSLVLWNVDTMDWRPEYEGRWVEHAMGQIVAQKENIVLAHDTIITTVANVGSLIANIQKLSDSRFIQYSETFAENDHGQVVRTFGCCFRQTGE
jgi:hypothetical protein